MKLKIPKKTFVPNNWSIESHTDIKSIDIKKISLHLENEQKESSISGDTIRDRLKGKEVLNANVLDYLLAHPELIPESWKVDEKGRTRYIFFWGTIYRNSGGYLYVQSLYWGGGQWHWGRDWLGAGWNVNYSAAVLAPDLDKGKNNTADPVSFESRLLALEADMQEIKKIINI